VEGKNKKFTLEEKSNIPDKNENVEIDKDSKDVSNQGKKASKSKAKVYTDFDESGCHEDFPGMTNTT